MATNWITVSADDLGEVLSLEVQNDQNENIGAGVAAGNPLNPEQVTRLSAIVTTLIAEIRASIDTGGRVPLSATANTIPPEAKRHLLNLAAFQLVAAKPNLKMFILFEGGSYSPSADLAKQAQRYIEQLRHGEQCTYPTDPDETSLAGTGGSAGDIVGTYDMTTN